MSDNDEILFSAEDESDRAAGADQHPWRILIVDDEEEVHAVTTLALSGFTFQNRGLEFLHAYSGEQAREILKRELDVGLILLDVIMETDDAGLQVARYVREELKNSFVRIILRTGQPGQAPEKKVITTYDINDYKEKTELTSAKLYTVVFTGLSSYRDLRALEAAREQLKEKNNALQCAYSDLESFAHMASHDLQAPLRTINLFLRRVLDRHGDTLADEVAETLERVIASAVRMRDLTDSLLALSQVNTRQIILVTVDLSEVVDSVRDTLSGLIELKNATLELQGDLKFRTEPVLLKQLLQNLVENALKYHPAGSKPQVSVSAIEYAEYLEIHVRDNGLGIAEEHIRKIFTEFERLHSNSEIEGSGIGLAICARVVQRLGGKIWVESTVGKGSDFIFTLAKISRIRTKPTWLT